jgi:signal transduction histidine kinase
VRRRWAAGAGGGAFAAAGTVLTGHDGLAVAAATVLGGALAADPRRAWIIASVALAVLALTKDDLLLATLVLVPLHAFRTARREHGIAAVAGPLTLLAAWELSAAAAGVWGGPAALLTAAGWGAGHAVRTREDLVRALTARARELEEERAAHIALSVRFERASIASELHDIVAHAISVMVVQSAAAQRLVDQPAAVAASFDAIGGAARQATQDLDQVVLLLGDERTTRAAPDMALLEELLTRAAASGLDVTLRLEHEPESLPEPIAHLLFQIVREGLTNALRYAVGAHVQVHIGGDAGNLRVEVRNAPSRRDSDLDGTGTGTGISGLRARVTAEHGTLEAGPTQDGGWSLRASLPVP